MNGELMKQGDIVVSEGSGEIFRPKELPPFYCLKCKNKEFIYQGKWKNGFNLYQYDWKCTKCGRIW